MADAQLRGIYVHPVKGCRHVELDRVTVSVCGLEGDRTWQVVDADSRAVTQRQEKRLALIQPTLVAGGVRLEADGYGAVDVADPACDAQVVRSVLGDRVSALDGGDDAASWLERLLGAPCRLVRLASLDTRHLRLVPEQPVSFADAAPATVASLASLRDLQGRALEPFGMERFRMNLVVDGSPPWDEDTWESFSIGGASLRALMPWPRCPVPQIDQRDASRHREPAVALRAHRWCTDAPTAPESLRPFLEGNALFGIGTAIGPAGTVLQVGDPVVVGQRIEPLIAPPA